MIQFVKDMRWVWLSLLFSYASMGSNYSYNFYMGKDRMTVFGTGTPPVFSMNGKIITCKCGEKPNSILVVDGDIDAWCPYHLSKMVDAYENLFTKSPHLAPDCSRHTDELDVD